MGTMSISGKKITKIPAVTAQVELSGLSATYFLPADHAKNNYFFVFVVAL